MTRHAPRRLLAAALAAAATTHGFAAGERLTTRCTAGDDTGELILFIRDPHRATIAGIVADPASHAEAYQRLWRPRSAANLLGDGYLLLGFDPVQDLDEIAAAVNADPVLRSLGVLGSGPNGYVCPLPPPPQPVTITEYRNQLLDHYFLSSSAEENAAIESGAAGPGWARTGEVFRATAHDTCHGTLPVQRFYNLGANTHFFTVDRHECGLVRRSDPGWFHEGVAFGAYPPAGGACPAGLTPLYRLYNDRWMHHDSNHRFVARLDLYAEMQSRGWVAEGVAMCLRDAGT